MADETLEARRWLRQRLGAIATQYPELKAAEHQQRLEAELERQQALEDVEATLCLECGAPALHKHHVIPRVSGGTKTVPLCEQCHSTVHESDLRISALTALALQDKRAKGQKLGGRVPYGMQLSADGVHLETNLHEQGVIRIARDLWQRGLSSRKIAAQLADQGMYGRTGKPFSPSVICNMVAFQYYRTTVLQQEDTTMPYKRTGHDVGRPKTYQSDEERPATVSLRIPRDVYEQAQKYVRIHNPMTLTDLLLDGLRLRLETPADPRDIILSDDNTVIRELQEMIQAAVQCELGKLSAFMQPQGNLQGAIPPEAAAEPAPALSPDGNTIIQEVEGIPLVDPSGISPDDNTVLQEQAQKRPGRQSTVRQPIIDLLRQHPEGLTAVQIKVHLGIEKNIGDTLTGMVRNHVLAKKGSGKAVRYLAVGAASTATKEPSQPKRRATRKAGAR
jgi:hypothetical protein